MISSTIQNSKKILSIMDLEPKKHEFIWLLYSWIMPQTDDFGHFDADARVVKAKILPCSPRPIKDFQKAIEVLEQVGLIIVYGDGPFMEIVGFLDHQTLRKDRAHISQFPERTDVNTRKHDGLPMTTNGLPMTPISEVKLSKDKLSKDNKDIEKTKFLDCVMLKESEHEKLITSFGDKKTKDLIQRLNDYIMSKGVNYKSHYHTIMMWERKDKKPGQTEGERMAEKHAGAITFANKVVTE
jgi:hypothetical protein